MLSLSNSNLFLLRIYVLTATTTYRILSAKTHPRQLGANWEHFGKYIGPIISEFPCTQESFMKSGLLLSGLTRHGAYSMVSVIYCCCLL